MRSKEEMTFNHECAARHVFDSHVYLVATECSPGGGVGNSNPAFSMMVALGPCTSLAASTGTNVNEVTTVARVWALAPLMRSATEVGTDDAEKSRLRMPYHLDERDAALF